MRIDISDINWSAIVENWPHISTIELRGTNISTLPDLRMIISSRKQLLLQIQRATNENQKKILLMMFENNPWQCDEQLLWVLDALKGDPQNYTGHNGLMDLSLGLFRMSHGVVDSMRCHTPMALKGVPVKELSHSWFTKGQGQSQSHGVKGSAAKP